jgi:hypothetical protein
VTYWDSDRIENFKNLKPKKYRNNNFFEKKLEIFRKCTNAKLNVKAD